MSNISDLKKQILEARGSKDLKKELNLTRRLGLIQRESKKKITAKDVYAQLADSP